MAAPTVHRSAGTTTAPTVGAWAVHSAGQKDRQKACHWAGQKAARTAEQTAAPTVLLSATLHTELIVLIEDNIYGLVE